MKPILVSGLINIETTLRVEKFPVEYAPVLYPFYGVNSTVSGVGYNVAKALTVLGSQARLLSLVGQDFAGEQALKTLQAQGVASEGVLPELTKTAQSVILYDAAGRRQINTDLKDIQERSYPTGRFEQALRGCSLAALCNINFSRPFLQRAKAAGVPVATDVHAVGSLEDEYNRDFMEAADILFMSGEALPCPPEEWAREVLKRFGAEIVVVGLGSQGALLGLRRDGFVGRVPAVQARPVVSTIGAGDALFSAFLHFYQKSGNAYGALRRAVVFASYKTGEAGAADGFLGESGVEQLYAEMKNQG